VVPQSNVAVISAREIWSQAKNQVFDKWSQTLGSADDLVTSATFAHEKRGVQEFFTCILPILVLSDNILWVADYSDEGVLEAAPTPVTEATQFVGRKYYSKFSNTCTLSHLHICTRGTIGHFLSRLANDGNFWQSVFPEAAIRDAIEEA